jgi:hypothetical protein
MDKPGRKVRTGFPLCKHGTSSRQHGLIRKPLEILTLRQPDPFLTLYHPILLRCWDIYLNLNTRAAAILLTASDMHNGGFLEGLGRGCIIWGKVARWFSARRPFSEKVDR